jgi:RNA polymerase sigma factor (sigma-70 family)
MKELKNLVEKAQDGDLKAYEKLIERFKPMAFGYSYSILKESDNAEDAVQESFIEAYYKLNALRQPEAFPGWFKRIVFKHCDRILRKPGSKNLRLPEDGNRIVSPEPEPDKVVEKNELYRQVNSMIDSLPEEQRVVLTLFYIKDHSIKDISGFLEISTATVKKRLHDSRQKLKERMTEMVKDAMPGLVPGEIFSKKIIDELLKRPKPLNENKSPVRKIFDSIMEALDGVEYIESKETIEVSQLKTLKKDVNKVYHLDNDLVLRDDTTISLLGYLKNRIPPLRICTAGRVFRPDKEDATHSKVFHQLEVMVINETASEEQMLKLAEKIIKKVLGADAGISYQDFKYPGFSSGKDVYFTNEDESISVAGCGMINRDLLKKYKIDPDRYTGFGLGIGLERLAMIKYGISKISDLFQS